MFDNKIWNCDRLFFLFFLADNGLDNKQVRIFTIIE